MPKLSIITINRNNAEGLRKTIESVINQTSKAFEYIVIDGASTDKSLEVIKQYKDKITYWISEPDKGIYNAMNKGIIKAKGEYCQFLNSGDVLVANDVIEQMLFNMPDTSIVIGNMLKSLANGKIYKDRGSAAKEISMFTFYRGTLNHSPAFIKRDLFDKYGFYDETLKIASDMKWYLIAVGLNNETVLYRDIDVTLFDMNGISTTNTTLDKSERRQVLEELIPKSILADYDKYWFAIEQTNRINKYKFIKLFVWFVERLLFKFEKWISKL
jgi:glycosyltransferase involved in cell wall biosynthesis